MPCRARSTSDTPGRARYERTAERCPKCGRAFPAAPRYSDEGGVWSRIVRHWLDADPKRSVLVVDISDPVYSW